jgi:hypothetical protein
MDIQCIHCEAELEAGKECFGKICSCPNCGKDIEVPAASEIQCPLCSGTILETDTACKHCGSTLPDNE